ncbi:hypothetical protein [Streptomyces noursei]|uniref:hypothetical protein n=1 Tax=Streptomyces noursei TaxID=1971 RepID=UPI00167690B8|nr:hypothetical protein [Streptomyces noursei]MCZ1021040.1 hypothetical protein [Streptomyces noursei]
MVKHGTDRWSNHLLRRMQACDPEITTASISPEDFSVTLNGSPFDARAVAGHGMARTNVSTVLALLLGRSFAKSAPAWLTVPPSPAYHRESPPQRKSCQDECRMP